MTAETKDGRPAITAQDAQAWRAWLAQHYTTTKGAWLIIHHKKSGVPSVYYDEAVEQALCFGWVDSKPNKRDEQSYYLYFAPRKATSNWSRPNRERVEHLIATGQMTAAGLAMVEKAKANGSWTALMDIEKGILPDDLQNLLDQHPTAKAYFEAFPPSTKRGILEWILNAKRPATREKRINETVELAAQNIRANQYRP